MPESSEQGAELRPAVGTPREETRRFRQQLHEHRRENERQCAAGDE